MSRFGYLKTTLFCLVCLLMLTSKTNAQSPPPTPELHLPTTGAPTTLAGQSTLFCAGYIRYQKLQEMPEIVGAQDEQEQYTFADGDVVYLNAGSQQGIKEGQTFQIIRSRGTVKGVHKHKKGFLGIYVQEVGQLQVFKVRENTAAARITFSCDSALLGDLLAPVPDRPSLYQRAAGDLDRYSDPTNKQAGHLMMAKDSREMVTRNDVVYLDLGSEDQIKPGDYLTIYRPLGTGNLTRADNEERACDRDT